MIFDLKKQGIAIVFLSSLKLGEIDISEVLYWIGKKGRLFDLIISFSNLENPYPINFERIGELRKRMEKIGRRVILCDIDKDAMRLLCYRISSNGLKVVSNEHDAMATLGQVQ